MPLTKQGSMKIYASNRCLKFDGSGDYVTLPPNLNIGGSMTVSAWVNMTNQHTADSSYPTVINKWNDDDDNQGTCWSLVINHFDYRPTFLRMGSLRPTGGGAGKGGRSFIGNKKLASGQWHHIVATYEYIDKDHGTIKLYSNGELDTSWSNQTNCSGLTYSYNGNTYIGGNQGEPFSGQIHDIRLYSGLCMTPSQIKMLYNGIDIKDHLFGHWKCDDRKGTTVKDYSNYKRDGTITNATWSDRDIKCWCSRWDEGNWDLTVETFLDACDRNLLFDSVTPGATRELYNVLGLPKFFDSTYSYKNTLIIEPITGFGISSLRKGREVAVKNISDTFLNKETFGVKIECNRIDIT